MSEQAARPLSDRPNQWGDTAGQKEIAKRAWRRLIGRRLRKGITDELAFIIGCAYSAGYRDAHDWQMKQRVRDAQECREKHGGRPL